jgi:putative protease
MDCVRAAIENGADAVYFGVQKWNARARAANFAVEELPDLFSMLRLRGVKGYVAFNTLVFSNELDEATALLEKILEAGPDAFILQDFGIARLLSTMAPGVALHASTQTTTTTAEQMDHLRELGFSRVILARELSLADLRKIRAGTDMPLEVFVHGALCVAYSGQCLTSEALGGRSANRGACAQACRLPYDLLVDGRVHEVGDRKYLISPHDLAAFDLIPEFAGLVDSIKIEGRLKTPEYVAATTRAYRKAVDQARPTFERGEVLELEQVFSRGLTHGFLDGTNHQALVDGRSPKKRGPFLGRVASVRGPRVTLALESPLKPGDGIVYDYGRPEEDEPGGRVLHLWKDGARVDQADRPDQVEMEIRECPPPQPGWRVWKTSDPAMYRALRTTFEKTGARVPVDAQVDAREGRLRVTLSDGVRQVTGETGPLQEARTRPLSAEFLREQLGRMGQTPFLLRRLDVRLGNVIVPVSQINELRRRLCEDLTARRQERPVLTLQRGSRPGRLTPRTELPDASPELVVLCRTPEQVTTALEEGATWIECDFEDIRRYRDVVPRARDRNATILLAPPRIQKPGETGILRNVLGAGPDGILIRSTAHLRFFAAEAPSLLRVGDFSLNIANELAADWFLAKGLHRIVPSYDLNWDQFQALAARSDPARLEVTIHQHMPMFHMEHCVFAAILSTGKDCTDCGRPCDRHDVRLRDWSGMVHPLKADVGCRNTIYNAVPQSASPYVHRMRELGIRWFRVELLLEGAEATRRLLRGYRDVVHGRSDGQTLWKELRASTQMGVTRGPLGRPE